MKLAELLKLTTPLPWPINEHGSVLRDKYQLRDKICLTGFALAQGSDTQEADANNRYVHHAANVLPELVRRLRFVIFNGQVMSNLELVELVSEALLVCEEVQDHSEQLTPDAKPQTVEMP